PEGGWTLPIAMPEDRDEETTVLDLLAKRDVLTSPGWFFEFGPRPHLVVSLLAPPEDFREAASRIAAFFEGPR
ncbi:MAG: hypothetical protein ACRD16_05425, partial [Thermoanaerobaculia bacterium]